MSQRSFLLYDQTGRRLRWLHALWGLWLSLSVLVSPLSVQAVSQIDINGPTGSGRFGQTVTLLPNGNLVVTDPTFSKGVNPHVGAVYLYNGATGALLSTLTGGTPEDQVGSAGVTVLSNGNYVVLSPTWSNGGAAAGAATWGNGATGVNGLVSAANSLIGSTAGDNVGYYAIVLNNGNYVVGSPAWHNGAVVNAGAVTWGNGATGISGVVGASNSLVGGAAEDRVGYYMTPLNSGNYVVTIRSWHNSAGANVGAVTWGNGATGISGLINSSNSLTGGTTGDQVGDSITLLSNGNYVVRSLAWHNGATADAGAVTWGNGATGISGVVNATNSLVGSTTGDQVGNVIGLSNGNYVVVSPAWHNGAATDAGAVTWGNGATGVSGAVNSTNSLVGATAGDQVGNGGVTVLSKGNYVVASPAWHNGATANAGAVTWGSGVAGISGVVNATNSLVGSTADDLAGNGLVTVLNNGNYLVSSPHWHNGAAADAGAVTWGSGATGVNGIISNSNSLVGVTAGDLIGYFTVKALSNGNYVVPSPNWDTGATANVGAATWGSGVTGISGVINGTNSFIGATAGDQVGADVTALSNGNYVVSSPSWQNGVTANAGAITWADGAVGGSGPINNTNSLIGSTTGDQVGGYGVTALSNGNYVVRSPSWSNGADANAGAVTWGSGTTGVSGVINNGNSLVGGTTADRVGDENVTPLSNGNYVVSSPNWHNSAAASAGAVTWGNGATGVSGVVNSANSLIGGTANDQVGKGSVTRLSNGNYVVLTPSWQKSATAVVGAVTWGNGASGVTGLLNNSNSVLGVTVNGNGLNFADDPFYVQLVVGRPADNAVTLFRPLNHAPMVAAQSISTKVGTPITIAFKASDLDGDPVTYTITKPPVKGLLSGSGDSRLYTPNPTVTGVDSFVIQVCDNATPPLCTTAQITVTITALDKAFLPLVEK